MKPKSQPMRTCVGCGEPKVKRELIRVALSPDGNISIDRTGKAPGRGAYLCESMSCF
ncbi:MAG: YlxR family protein [Veillonella sp.]